MNIKTAPLWQWILLLIASLFLAFIGYGMVAVTEEFHSWALSFAASLFLIVLYVLVVRWFEKEWTTDILARRGPRDLLLGLAIGAMFFCVVVGVMRLFGICTLMRLSFDWNAQLTAFMMFFGVAVGEEILFRGVLFKWIDKRWGPWWALLVSGLVFGLVHVTNNNATWWSGIAIAIEAGLLLGAAYKWSGTLWLPIGIHWAWNYTQGNIFGFAVSGNFAGSSWLKVVTTGPDLLTGGAFGPEASIISVVLGVAIAAWLVWDYMKHTNPAGFLQGGE